MGKMQSRSGKLYLEFEPTAQLDKIYGQDRIYASGHLPDSTSFGGVWPQGSFTSSPSCPSSHSSPSPPSPSFLLSSHSSPYCLPARSCALSPAIPLSSSSSLICSSCSIKDVFAA